LKLNLRCLESLLGRFASVDIAPGSDDLNGVAMLVADQMLLVAYPTIGAVLLAETVFGEMHALSEQLGLLCLDLGQVFWMHMRAPKVRIPEILVRAEAQHVRDIGADESWREIAGCSKAIDDRGRRPEEEGQPRARGFARLLGLFAWRDVGPGAHDLDRLPLGIAQQSLLVVHPPNPAGLPHIPLLNRLLVTLE